MDMVTARRSALISQTLQIDAQNRVESTLPIGGVTFIIRDFDSPEQRPAVLADLKAIRMGRQGYALLDGIALRINDQQPTGARLVVSITATPCRIDLLPRRVIGNVKRAEADRDLPDHLAAGDVGNVDGTVLRITRKEALTFCINRQINKEMARGIAPFFGCVAG